MFCQMKGESISMALVISAALRRALASLLFVITSRDLKRYIVSLSFTCICIAANAQEHATVTDVFSKKT